MRKFNLLDSVAYGFISVFSMFCILPMMLVAMVSLTDEDSIKKYGYQLIPKDFSLEAYSMLMRRGETLLNSYGISVFITIIGTLVAITITAMAGYVLANQQVKLRNVIALYFFITMIFNAGIVPWYIVNSNLGLRNNIFALLIPNLIFNPFNMFLVRNFMRSIPDALMESAKIDGAGDAYILFRIYMPLCKPVLAAISLFYGIGYWNDWWNAIMLVENQRLYPLQYFLFRLQSETQMLRDLQIYSGNLTITLPTESLKMATALVTIGPIILLYPFLQRHFVKGLIIGSVKG